MYEGLKKRRSYYNIGKEIPVSQEEVIELVKNVVELVPCTRRIPRQALGRNI